MVMGRTPHLGPFSVPSSADVAAADAALTTLGLAHLAAEPVAHLSGGQRQLGLIARAVAQAAPVVVMDEPSASLDFGNRLRVAAEIRRLRAAGAAVLLSTHDPDQALALADQVALFDGTGRVAVG
ncbi:ABC transporter ATP-binding protein, partial [Mycobacterium tuberculosis]|nr:ABC transporter ATP-binding protein [Mycobacterium tuberculosis]